MAAVASAGPVPGPSPTAVPGAVTEWMDQKCSSQDSNQQPDRMLLSQVAAFLMICNNTGPRKYLPQKDDEEFLLL